MAKLIPNYIIPGNRSPGEKDLFDKFACAPGTDDWIVLHSLNVSEHAKKIESELDFVVIVPELGVLCIEVKAHLSIARRDGVWIFGRGVHKKRDRLGPFDQARTAMYALRKYVSERDSRIGQVIPFFFSVFFTHADFDVASSEWHQWQLVNKTLFESKPITDIVLSILHNGRSHMASKAGNSFQAHERRPNLAESKRLLQILRGNFEFIEPAEVRLLRHEKEIKRFTEEQFDALDLIGGNERVLFTGLAGTGKTFLAIEATRRAAAAGLRVRFVCFNRLLASWVASQLRARQVTAQVSTLHQVLLAVTNAKIPLDATNDFWEEYLPLRALENLLEDPDGQQYDIMVLDEAQDIVHNPLYLDVLDLLLEGGLDSGHWFIFGDFEKQAIYANSLNRTSEENLARLDNCVKGALSVNCRNSPEVSQYATLLSQIERPYRKILRGAGSASPIIRWYKSGAHQKRVFAGVLDSLLDEGVRLRDLVVLSTRNESNSLIRSLDDGLQEMFAPLAKIGFKRWKAEQERAVYASIHAFKGLEARHVIITDVDEVGSEMMNSLLYIGITRALHTLAILASEKAKTQFIDKLKHSG